MAAYYVSKITKMCSLIIGHCCDTTIATLHDKNWQYGSIEVLPAISNILHCGLLLSTTGTLRVANKP